MWNDFVCFNNAFAAHCGTAGANDCNAQPVAFVLISTAV
jgi:hypothetical protein